MVISPGRTPAAAALNMATRSAHTVKPKEEFSTLQPVKMSPDFVNSAAPTLNLEKGTYAFSRVFSAFLNNF